MGGRRRRTSWTRQPFDGIAGVGDLRFTALATRAKKENYLVIASDYEQPFGTFTGRLPTGRDARARDTA